MRCLKIGNGRRKTSVGRNEETENDGVRVDAVEGGHAGETRPTASKAVDLRSGPSKNPESALK